MIKKVRKEMIKKWVHKSFIRSIFYRFYSGTLLPLLIFTQKSRVILVSDLEMLSV